MYNNIQEECMRQEHETVCWEAVSTTVRRQLYWHTHICVSYIYPLLNILIFLSYTYTYSTYTHWSTIITRCEGFNTSLSYMLDARSTNATNDGTGVYYFWEGDQTSCVCVGGGRQFQQPNRLLGWPGGHIQLRVVVRWQNSKQSYSLLFWHTSENMYTEVCCSSSAASFTRLLVSW